MSTDTETPQAEFDDEIEWEDDGEVFVCSIDDPECEACQ